MNLRKHVFLAMAFAFLMLPCAALAAQEEKTAVAPVAEAPQAAPAKLDTFQPDDAFVKDRLLLDRLQYDAFRYMWEHTFAESGLAYEDSRNKESGQATIGGSGFGGGVVKGLCPAVGGVLGGAAGSGVPGGFAGVLASGLVTAGVLGYILRTVAAVAGVGGLPVGAVGAVSSGTLGLPAVDVYTVNQAFHILRYHWVNLGQLHPQILQILGAVLLQVTTEEQFKEVNRFAAFDLHSFHGTHLAGKEIIVQAFGGYAVNERFTLAHGFLKLGKGIQFTQPGQTVKVVISP